MLELKNPGKKNLNSTGAMYGIYAYIWLNIMVFM